jgi:tripartite-type tricarboxylate transporter receptor subunit TctC
MLRFCHLRAWIAAAFALLAFGVAAAQAQTGYPDRPVKIIVPIGAGGSYDLVGRYLADVLSKRTGQAFFVENKPGAGTVGGHRPRRRASRMAIRCWSAGSPTWPSIRRCIRSLPTTR